MSTYLLTVFPDGRMLLTTPQALSPDAAQRLMEQWKAWRETPAALAIIAECDVERATSIEIDLPERVA